MKFIKKIKEKFPVSSIKIDLNKKEFISSVLFLSIIYVLAISSIIRANFSYIDDLRRSIEGNALGGSFSRHISNFLGYFIHAGGITDISPLPQLVACFILAITGFLLVKIICNKTNYWLLIASLPLGISPYFLECFSYKFDAPYMAISILASVFPFIFMNKNRWLFSVICLLSTLVMTMTYQAASGIFLMLTLYVFFTNLNYKRTTLKKNFIFLCISLISFCVAILMFRLWFMIPNESGSYVSTEMTKFTNLITVFLHNLYVYSSNIIIDFNLEWKILLLVIITIYYVKTVIQSKINKILTFFLTPIFLFLLFLSAFGLYLLLISPFYGPRAVYGFGAFIAILCIDIVFSLKKIFAIPVITLIWCFFVFYFSYGNVLADQKRYNDFRNELLLKDLSSLLPKKTDTGYSIKIINNEGLSRVAKHSINKYPIIRKLVPIYLQEGWAFGCIYLTAYNNFQLTRDEDIEDETMPVVFDSYYHTIKYNNNQVVVILK